MVSQSVYLIGGGKSKKTYLVCTSSITTYQLTFDQKCSKVVTLLQSLTVRTTYKGRVISTSSLPISCGPHSSRSSSAVAVTAEAVAVILQ